VVETSDKDRSPLSYHLHAEDNNLQNHHKALCMGNSGSHHPDPDQLRYGILYLLARNKENLQQAY